MPTEQEKLQGAWKVTEITLTGPNATTSSNPQPGYALFADNYLSFTMPLRGGPRKAPADMSKATADELREVLRFMAQVETFQIKGDEIISQVIVSLRIASMAPGNMTVHSYKIEGDKLTLIEKSNQNGLITNPSTVKLRRIQ